MLQGRAEEQGKMAIHAYLHVQKSLRICLSLLWVVVIECAIVGVIAQMCGSEVLGV
jgi:hypothetical protein